MEQNKNYFKEQEEYVANNYMSANGIESQGETSGTGYKLFTSQYFIGIGVGMVFGYFFFKPLKK
tara:strand:- start:916 stop:1107 length:192 start_codon:yes stop_codon:yes gene_type:complete